MDHSPPLPPSLSALWNDLSLEQVDALIALSQKYQVPIIDIIDRAILEEEKRYLIQHQAEPGNQWMREILSRMVVWLWIIVLPIWWDMIDDYIPFLHK